MRKRTAAKATDAPPTKKAKTTVPSKSSTATTNPQVSAAPSSSWQADPILVPANLVPAAEENLQQLFCQHWPQIRPRFSPKNRLQD